jgi:hypothetical protein
MMIERIMPELVGDRDTLRHRLEVDARAVGISDEDIAPLMAVIPPSLRQAECFEDKLTGLWRYEFGEPYHLKRENKLLWGTHIWVPVTHLRQGLNCLLARVATEKRKAFLIRLDQPQKHLDVLSEMIPALNIAPDIKADFEVVGLGQGNRTIDWLIGPIEGREILLDVKRRSIDLIKQLDQLTEGQPPREPDQ